ncbi:ATP-binding cassette sub-family C member Sur-like [Ctenocephalides felis]|nr:ATP-binding cassette sub-family C member Sur-like [Ctenocephalides felis]
MFGQHLCRDKNCKRYKKVLKLCALDKELTEIQQSNLQTIGENGNTLSGGQKQRICLARAIYSGANVVALDDPFSALDEQVSQQVFDSTIQNYLLRKNITVVMATNKLKLLQYADQIIALEDNKIRAVGSLKELEVIDPILTKSWKNSLSNEKSENTRTAKDRWRLCRMVTSASFHFNKKTNLISNTRPEFTPPRSTRSSIAYDPCLSFDLPLLWNELTESNDGLLTRNSSIRSCYSHKPTARAISLQSQRHRNSRIFRNNFGNLPNMEEISEKPNGHEDIRSKRHTIDSPHASNILRQILSKTQNVNKTLSDNKSGEQRNIFRRLADRLSFRRSNRSKEINRHKIISRLMSDASDITVDLNDLASCETHQISSLSEYNYNQRTAENQERIYGTIPLNIYLYYIKCCGIKICTLYIFLAFLWQGLRLFADMSLGNWSRENMESYEGFDQSHEKAFSLLSTYCYQSAICALVSLLCAFSGQWAGLVARSNIHEYLTTAVLKDNNIYGEIGSTINRFSTDMSVIDKKLCSSIQRLVQFLLLCLCAILVNCIVSLWFLVVTIFIGTAYYAVQKFYRRSSRELQRLESLSRSPIFTLFSDTCRGAQTIRIYSKSKEFSRLMFLKLDDNTNSQLLLDTSARWLGVALDCLGGFIVFASALTALYFTESENSSIAGFALNSTLLAPMYLNWVVRFISEVEISANAVHRIKIYCDDAEEDIEYDPKSQLKKIQDDIPEENFDKKNSASKIYLEENDKIYDGDVVQLRKNSNVEGSLYQIIFNKVTLHHHLQSNAVITNLNLVIAPGEKLAVCGRTASGKSSLFLSLFGLMKITQGAIMLGNVNLTNLDKQKFTEIRDKLCCVSQEGALFSGSFRHNLDPKGEYTDEQIWGCLELVKMKNFIEEFPGGLDNEISTEGGSLSHGQRQLICLARVALKAKWKSTYPIILDECTSAVDPQTEKIVLKDFWKTFHDRTIICIAHRLSVIMDFDRVIVLENGKIIENDRPEVLRHSQNGKFAAMLKTSEM